MGTESLVVLSQLYTEYIDTCHKTGEKELGFLAFIVNSLKGTL